ncbi:MAG: hypothetical protein LBU27_09820 [Candidatus Peribacteria bacterium]|jgi:hypothetical protein|nr:hypothetical protein [Candidatus Peribacteria bacterium]
MKYTIVAFPQEKTLKQLNSIREYLYTNGFRYTMTAPKGNVHITLSQLEITDASYNLTELKELLSKPLRTQHKFNLSHREIVNQEHTRISSSPELTEKYPKGCAWIAIVFQNTQLFSLAEEMRKVLIPLGIDTSLVYAQKIASTK